MQGLNARRRRSSLSSYGGVGFAMGRKRACSLVLVRKNPRDRGGGSRGFILSSKIRQTRFKKHDRRNRSNRSEPR